jgi:tRNA(Ile2) C34 agmatinyltransferase TiaS
MKTMKEMISIPESLWIGLDDTDSLAGGCTTEIFHRMLCDLDPHIEVIEARLVRLWPFAPRRTRGNAAVCAHISVKDRHEFLDKLSSYYIQFIEPLKGQIQPSHHSSREQVASDPGLVVFEDQPDEHWYYRGVRGIVHEHELPKSLISFGGNGKIGATCAVAWRANISTWEVIAYRKSTTSKRSICLETLQEINSYDGNFLSMDSKNQRQLVSPKGNSPVLFGVRGLHQDIVLNSGQMLANSSKTESISGIRLFRTNQATNDHIESVLNVQILSNQIQNKHVILKGTNGERLKIFYESGLMNRYAKLLECGDNISIRGMKDSNGLIHVENLKIDSIEPRKKKRPKCVFCDRTMKSMGKGQGIRCPTCKKVQADSFDTYIPNIPVEMWLEPPDDQRRHLARPLNL